MSPSVAVADALLRIRSHPATACDPQKKKIGQKQPNIAGLKRAINAGSIFCGAQRLRAALCTS